MGLINDPVSGHKENTTQMPANLPFDMQMVIRGKNRAASNIHLLSFYHSLRQHWNSWLRPYKPVSDEFATPAMMAWNLRLSTLDIEDDWYFRGLFQAPESIFFLFLVCLPNWPAMYFLKYSFIHYQASSSFRCAFFEIASLAWIPFWMNYYNGYKTILSFLIAHPAIVCLMRKVSPFLHFHSFEILGIRFRNSVG